MILFRASCCRVRQHMGWKPMLQLPKLLRVKLHPSLAGELVRDGLLMLARPSTRSALIRAASAGRRGRPPYNGPLTVQEQGRRDRRFGAIRGEVRLL